MQPFCDSAVGSRSLRTKIPPTPFGKRIPTFRNAPTGSRSRISTRQDRRPAFRAHILAFQNRTQALLCGGLGVPKSARKFARVRFGVPGLARELG